MKLFVHWFVRRFLLFDNSYKRGKKLTSPEAKQNFEVCYILTKFVFPFPSRLFLPFLPSFLLSFLLYLFISFFEM